LRMPVTSALCGSMSGVERLDCVGHVRSSWGFGSG
jgi:hypothetical protein